MPTQALAHLKGSDAPLKQAAHSRHAQQEFVSLRRPKRSPAGDAPSKPGKVSVRSLSGWGMGL